MRTRNWMENMGEPIQVCEKRFYYCPNSLRGRRQLHRVRTVERCWMVNHYRVLNSAQRHCSRARTVNATHNILQELESDTSVLHRVVEERS